MRNDLTKGPILKTLLAFSLPTLLSNGLQSLNGTVNAIWVGRMIGEEALAATANAHIILFLLSAGAFGFGMAGTVKIGQRLGARNLDGARRAFGTVVSFCFFLTLIIAVVGWMITPWLLDLLGTPEGAWELALGYLRMIFFSMPLVMMSIIVTMGLRGSGDSRTPLIFMGVSVAINFVLVPLFISGYGPFPQMGMVGAALAMLISSGISFAAMIAYIYIRDLPLRLRGHELAYLIPDREELRFIISKGVPMGVQMAVMGAAGLIVMNLVNREGLLTTAAYGAAQQLFTYIQMPAMAIGGGVSAMCAQYIGARKYDMLGKVTFAGVMINLFMTGTIAILMIMFDEPFLKIFLGSDSPAVPIASHIQLLTSWNFVIFGMVMVIMASMRAGGEVWMPLLVLSIALYPIRLGFYHLTYDWLGADAIWMSFPVAAISALFMAWWIYTKTAWRERAIAESEREAREQVLADAQPAGRMSPNM